MTDRAWFSRLVRHPARKQSGSILTTPEPARGKPKPESKQETQLSLTNRATRLEVSQGHQT